MDFAKKFRHPSHMTDEPRTPEGRLIHEAWKRSGQSARKVAAAVGISDTQFRHWMRGYDGRGGEVVFPVLGLSTTARFLGLTPANLREAGREDAASALERGQFLPASAESAAPETVGDPTQDAGVLLDMPPEALEGLGPAEREEVITAAKLSALAKAREIRRRLDE